MDSYALINSLSWILMLLGIVITIAAQIFVSSSYNKYKKKKVASNITGFEVARKILDNNGLKNIHIVETRGNLTDHYDPRNKVVRLSTDVFHGNSIASVAVAAHECGHAIQDKEGYTFLRIRSSIVPFVNISSKIGYVAIFIGFICGSYDLATIGIVLLLAMLAFQLVTLPVEFNASSRAKKQIDSLALAENKEQEGVSKMLTSAALTYVAALVTTLLEILRLALIIFGNNRD